MIHQYRCNGQRPGLSPGTGFVAAIVFVVAISSASAQGLPDRRVGGVSDSQRVHARGKHSADRSCGRTLEYRR